MIVPPLCTVLQVEGPSAQPHALQHRWRDGFPGALHFSTRRRDGFPNLVLIDPRWRDGGSTLVYSSTGWRDGVFTPMHFSTGWRGAFPTPMHSWDVEPVLSCPYFVLLEASGCGRHLPRGAVYGQKDPRLLDSASEFLEPWDQVWCVTCSCPWKFSDFLLCDGTVVLVVLRPPLTVSFVLRTLLVVSFV